MMWVRILVIERSDLATRAANDSQLQRSQPFWAAAG